MASTPDGMKRFYGILAGVAVIGFGVLAYLLSRPRSVSVLANVTVQAADTAGCPVHIRSGQREPIPDSVGAAHISGIREGMAGEYANRARQAARVACVQKNPS